MPTSIQIIIHRGTHSIGGNCVEIRCGERRIVLDIGLPLMGRDGAELEPDALKSPSVTNGILPDVPGLYAKQTSIVDAVLVSHAHPDHYGLMDWVHPEIPVFLSREAKALIEVGNVFYPERLKQKTLPERSQTFKHWNAFSVGPFKITPYLMDHSAFGASAFLIEVEGKKIFYSGDMRAHGRKAKVFERLVQHPIQGIDCMIMEGSMLDGRHYNHITTEIELENELFQHFSTQEDVSFVMASGSNIDRLVSMYKAVKRSKKTLVIDLYQMYMLDRLKEFAPNLPPHQKDEIRVLFERGQAQRIVDQLGKKTLFKYRHRKISIEEIADDRQNMVLRFSVYNMKRIAAELQKNAPLDKAKFFYSMWSGYLERNPDFQNFYETYGMPLHKFHVSGHALLQDLQRLTTALAPKTLLPIHTLAGDDFSQHFSNVRRVDDGEVFEIC